MSKKTTLISVSAIIFCGLIFATSLGFYFYQKNDLSQQVVTPTPQELGNVDKEPQGLLANISGSDLEKIDVKRGVAIYKDAVYFVKTKTEAEIRAEVTKLKPAQATTDTIKKTTTDKTSAEQDLTPKIDASTFASNQLMSWTASKGISLVADLSNVDNHPINRLSSVVEDGNLALFPCIPSTNPSVICESSKVYQFNLANSKLALLTDLSTSGNKEGDVKALNQKYELDDLGQPFWQDIQGDTIYGIKNVLSLDKSSTPTLTGYLVSSKDGVTEKPLVIGTQIARADLKINSKGNILIDQSGTLKASNSCVTEHRLLEINPNTPSEQKKDVVRKISLDDKGAWNDGVTRTDAEKKIWVDTCAALPEYKSQTPEQLLEINRLAQAKMDIFN